MPSKADLVGQLREIMAPVWDETGDLGDEPVRQVGGLGQVMVSESRCVLLLATATRLRPASALGVWARCRFCGHDEKMVKNTKLTPVEKPMLSLRLRQC